MGHKQGPIPLCTDSKTARRILSGVYKRKRSKSNDKNFHWLLCRIKQRQFRIEWALEKKTLEIPLSITIYPHITRKWDQSTYVEGKSPSTLKGCDEIMTKTPVKRMVIIIFCTHQISNVNVITFIHSYQKKKQRRIWGDYNLIKCPSHILILADVTSI